jgi:hypothetical protein
MRFQAVDRTHFDAIHYYSSCRALRGSKLIDWVRKLDLAPRDARGLATLRDWRRRRYVLETARASLHAGTAGIARKAFMGPRNWVPVANGTLFSERSRTINPTTAALRAASDDDPEMTVRF